jgi:hypothetical protein
MKGVISYFPSPGGVLYIVSMCIPVNRSSGGQWKYEDPIWTYPMRRRIKEPLLFSMPA